MQIVRRCLIAFNFFNNTASTYMSDIFSPSKVVKYTRSSLHRFDVPLWKTNMGKHAHSYAGPKLWNNIKIDVKLAKHWNIFRHEIKCTSFDTSQLTGSAIPPS